MMIVWFLRLKTATWLTASLLAVASFQYCCSEEAQEAGQPPSERNGPRNFEPPPSLLQKLRKELGTAVAPEENDPLIIVLELMKESQSRLAKKDTGEHTQQIQKKIIDVFDFLMNQAMEKAQLQPSQGTSQNNRQQQEETSQTSQTQTTQSDRGGGKERQATGSDRQASELSQVLQKVWGELPERERNMVLQHAAEAIVPKYRALIEAYYRELSRSNDSSP